MLIFADEVCFEFVNAPLRWVVKPHFFLIINLLSMYESEIRPDVQREICKDFRVRQQQAFSAIGRGFEGVCREQAAYLRKQGL